MICGKCQKNHATVHVTEVENGVKREAHLCEECARDSGVGLNFKFTVSDILGSLVGPAGPAKPAKAAAEAPQLRCPECGITYTEFKAKARLGCAADYEIFKQGLLPLLEKVHGSTQHVGKAPKTAGEQVLKESELARLKRELEGHVKSEDFEAAARVRDRIRTLEKELDGGA